MIPDLAKQATPEPEAQALNARRDAESAMTPDNKLSLFITFAVAVCVK